MAPQGHASAGRCLTWITLFGVHHGRPTGMEAYAVAVTGAHLGEPGTPTTLQHHLRALRSADVVQSAAKLTIWLEAPGGSADGARQEQLVDELFPAEIATHLRSHLRAGGDAGGFDALFFPGQLLALQRLALSEAQAGQPTSFNGGAEVGRFVLAAAQVNDVRDMLVPVAAEDMDEVDLSIYGIRAGEINRIPFPPAVAGRAYRLWVGSSIAWPTGAEDPESYCERRFGVSFRQFIAIAAAPALVRMQSDLADPGAVPFNPANYFAETRISSEVARRVLAELTFHPSQDRGVLRRPATYWCFFDLADRPLLPCGADIVVPCSLRHALERATTGVFWMLHAANAGAVGSLTGHFGRMFEAHCVATAKRLVSPIITVSGEIEYGRAATRRRSADILITAQSGPSAARIFIECRAGRPPRELFETGDRAAFRPYLEDILSKLGQLDRSIGDHAMGAFLIPDDLAEPDDPYFPVLVLDEPFQWTFAFRAIIDRELRRRGLFRQPSVTATIICSIGDFEHLIAACERGADVVSFLFAYLAEERVNPLDHVLYSQTGPLQPPTYCWEGWEQFKEGVMEDLFG